MKTDSMAADRAARDVAVRDAMRNLEDDVHSLLSMARILCDLLDHTLVSYEGGERRQMPKRGNPMKVYISLHEMEMLSFAWNNVVSRADRLRQEYEDVLSMLAGQRRAAA